MLRQRRTRPGSTVSIRLISRTGKILKGKGISDLHRRILKENLPRAETNPRLVAVTAAMPDGTGLKAFSNAIRTASLMWELAEQHAGTSAAWRQAD